LWTCGIIRQTRQRLQQIPAVESQWRATSAAVFHRGRYIPGFSPTR
jgi:hypothetical protein